jgi:hypothetical protein
MMMVVWWWWVVVVERTSARGFAASATGGGRCGGGKGHGLRGAALAADRARPEVDVGARGTPPVVRPVVYRELGEVEGRVEVALPTHLRE